MVAVLRVDNNNDQVVEGVAQEGCAAQSYRLWAPLEVGHDGQVVRRVALGGQPAGQRRGGRLRQHAPHG